MQIIFRNFICLFFVVTAISACGGLGNKQKYGNFKGYYKVGDPYQIDGQWYYPKEQPDYDETGIASWYGSDFHGKLTANGDTFDANSLTAAHNTLPLPSMVRVTNLDNNKSLVVMVNDRGPFSKGRVIDVSKRAAEILGFKDKGTAKVRVQFLKGYTQRLLGDIPKNADNTPAIKDKSASSLANNNDDVSTNSSTVVEVSSNHVDISDTPVDLSSAPAKKDIVETEAPKAISETPVKPASPVKKAAAKKATPVKAASATPVTTNKNVKEKPVASEVKIQPNPINSKEEEKITFLDDKNQKPAAKEDTSAYEEHYIQAGTYSLKTNAERAQNSLRAIGDVAIVPVLRNGKTLYKVQVGPIGDQKVAKLALAKVIKMGHPDAMLVSKN